MKIYINSTGNISPQKTFNGEFLDEIIEHEQTDHLNCVEPIYKDYINPMAARRMSKIIKNGYCAAKICLQEAAIDNPDAIIVGTGMGCIEDTEKFLTSIIENDEKLLNPTPFIQSTHNTIAAQIALLIKCHNYNFTYVHRGFSFESAMIDAMMMLNENKASNILTGASDELTNNFYLILKRLGFLKRKSINNLQLASSNSIGTIAGEGSTFFMLSNKETEKTYASLTGISTFFKPTNHQEISSKINKFLSQNNLNIQDIDLALLGINGDKNFDAPYYFLMDTIFQKTPSAYFKHLCGEYHTASAFGFWTGINILKNQTVPQLLKLKEYPITEFKNILIYNHYQNINHSLFLIRKC